MHLASGFSADHLEKNRVLSLALVKLVESIGEAATGVSGPRRATFAAIPWNQIIGTRHRLVHDYRAIDHEILCAILQNDLPSLVELLEKELPG